MCGWLEQASQAGTHLFAAARVGEVDALQPSLLDHAVAVSCNGVQRAIRRHILQQLDWQLREWLGRQGLQMRAYLPGLWFPYASKRIKEEA